MTGAKTAQKARLEEEEEAIPVRSFRLKLDVGRFVTRPLNAEDPS